MRNSILILASVVAVVLGVTQHASAQFIYAGGFNPPTHGAWGGRYGNFGPSYGTYGGFNNGYYPGNNGFFPGNNAWGWSAQSTTPLYFPGWVVSGQSTNSVFARNAMYPAVAVPANSPLLFVGGTSDAAAAPSRADVVILAPTESARIYLEGQLTAQTGFERRFTTPPLQNGKQYVYDVEARWTDAQGQPRSARQTVSFRPGDVVSVAFPRQ